MGALLLGGLSIPQKGLDGRPGSATHSREETRKAGASGFSVVAS
jgi:hypothetical protein